MLMFDSCLAILAIIEVLANWTFISYSDDAILPTAITNKMAMNNWGDDVLRNRRHFWLLLSYSSFYKRISQHLFFHLRLYMADNIGQHLFYLFFYHRFIDFCNHRLINHSLAFLFLLYRPNWRNFLIHMHLLGTNLHTLHHLHYLLILGLDHNLNTSNPSL